MNDPTLKTRTRRERQRTADEPTWQRATHVEVARPFWVRVGSLHVHAFTWASTRSGAQTTDGARRSFRGYCTNLICPKADVARACTCCSSLHVPAAGITLYMEFKPVVPMELP